MLDMQTRRVSIICYRSFVLQIYMIIAVASGFVARETIQLANLTLTNQAFGLVNNSNVTLSDQASGIMGLGFSRLSSISTSVPNGL